MAKHDAYLSLVFHALADPTRLAAGPAPVNDPARPTGLRLPTVMRHLTVLEDAGLITADIDARDKGSHITLTAQLSSLATQRAEGYRQGCDTGPDNLAGAAERTMVLRRVIKAPRYVVWGACVNADDAAEKSVSYCRSRDAI